MNIIDLTRQSMGWNNPPSTRNTNQIRRLGIHHSATTVGNQRIFENHWRNLGWTVGGYHEIILPNGDVEICYAPTTIVNGVGDHNGDTYHIAMVGNFRTNGAQPSQVQLRSFIERVQFNMNRFNIQIKNVLGHNEFTNTPRFNHRSNICPGMDMKNIRTQIQSVITPPVSTPNPTPENPVHVVRAGENLTTIANLHNTTVDELIRLNNIPNRNLIRIGQIIRLPDSSTPTPPISTGITVGSSVQVNTNASRWLTGQTIPKFVRGGRYDVMQLRSNNREVLIGRNGVATGWISINDLTVK